MTDRYISQLEMALRATQIQCVEFASTLPFRDPALARAEKLAADLIGPVYDDAGMLRAIEDIPHRYSVIP